MTATLYVDGKWCDALSGRTFDVLNPATGEVLGSAAHGSGPDARLAIEAAGRAFGPWSSATAYERWAYGRAWLRCQLRGE